MFRNMQLKIILIFFLVGIILIGGLGITFITNMNNINMKAINLYKSYGFVEFGRRKNGADAV